MMRHGRFCVVMALSAALCAVVVSRPGLAAAETSDEGWMTLEQFQREVLPELIDAPSLPPSDARPLPSLMGTKKKENKSLPPTFAPRAASFASLPPLFDRRKPPPVHPDVLVETPMIHQAPINKAPVKDVAVPLMGRRDGDRNQALSLSGSRQQPDKAEDKTTACVNPEQKRQEQRLASDRATLAALQRAVTELGATQNVDFMLPQSAKVSAARAPDLTAQTSVASALRVEVAPLTLSPLRP